MDPITMLGIGSAVVKGAGGIFGSIAGHNNQVAEARARNQAMMDEYKYRLQIRDKKYKDSQQIYGQKLAQYTSGMNAADRAASRAYGIEQFNQNQRLRQAAFQGLRLDRAFAKSGGAAVAAGKTGRTARRIDADTEANFVRNQNMIAANLLAAEETRQYRELGIQDRLQGQRNQLFGTVAIAPTVPLELPAPRQLSGPSSAGMGLGILNAGLGMASGIAGAFAPNVGGGGGGTGMPTNLSYTNVGSAYSVPTPLTSGMNFF